MQGNDTALAYALLQSAPHKVLAVAVHDKDLPPDLQLALLALLAPSCHITPAGCCSAVTSCLLHLIREPVQPVGLKLPRRWHAGTQRSPLPALRRARNPDSRLPTWSNDSFRQLSETHPLHVGQSGASHVRAGIQARPQLQCLQQSARLARLNQSWQRRSYMRTISSAHLQLRASSVGAGGQRVRHIAQRRRESARRQRRARWGPTAGALTGLSHAGVWRRTPRAADLPTAAWLPTSACPAPRGLRPRGDCHLQACTTEVQAVHSATACEHD
jgi:hypothetical protein